MNSFRKYAPGLGLAAVTAQTGFVTAHHLGLGLLSAQGVAVTAATASPISGIPIAIMLGLAGNNALGLNKAGSSTNAGVTLATKTVLQGGICCVGAKLSLFDLMTTGLVGIPAVAMSVFVGMTVIPMVGRRMGLTPKMSDLIASGTSICGVTAISAVGPAIKADEKESGFAIANVVAFGTFGMLAYPYLAHAVFAPDVIAAASSAAAASQVAATSTTAVVAATTAGGGAATSQGIGIFLGLAVHDTSQVIGSALTYSTVYADELVLKAAAVTKLTRNICLAGVVPYMVVKHADNDDSTAKKKMGIVQSLRTHTPMFVILFLVASAIRTLGDYLVSKDMPLAPYAASWKDGVGFVGNTLGSNVLLGTAMAGVGYSTKLSALRGVGMAPFVVGATGSFCVGSTGLMCAYGITQLQQQQQKTTEQ